MAYYLKKPYSNSEYENFILEYNHKKNMSIVFDDEKNLIALLPYEKYLNGEVLDFSKDYFSQKLLDLKNKKNKENLQKAIQTIENGFVVYKNLKFETNTQTLSDLIATILLLKTNNIESYTWLSKEDEIIDLSVEDFNSLCNQIASFKNVVWNNKYLTFKKQIDNAQTINELENIKIIY